MLTELSDFCVMEMSGKQERNWSHPLRSEATIGPELWYCIWSCNLMTMHTANNVDSILKGKALIFWVWD
jgi:hypothetical protein